MSRSARLWMFRIATAILGPLLLVVTMELGLRLIHYGHTSAYTVPCSVQQGSAFCDNDRFTWQFFPPGAFRLPHSFAIPAEKRQGTFRIFVVGESAAQGVPEPSYAFSRYLDAMLRDRYPQWRFEVINTSISSINSHVLLPIARDLTRRQGDLFILYIGNNEVVGPYGPGTTLTSQGSSLPLIRAGIFLKSTRLGQLLEAALRVVGKDRGLREWRGMRMFLEQQVPSDAPALTQLYRNFGSNLRDILTAIRESGVPVLISTVGVNLKDCAPFGSLHRPDLSAADLKMWDSYVQEAGRLEQAGKPAEALPQYLSASAIDDRYAELEFRIGHSYWTLGDYAAAKERYTRARELDVLRFRADGRINEIVRSVATAAGTGVELIDGEMIFADNSPHGVTGRELFHEHVHMNPRGNYLLARAVFPHVIAHLPKRTPETGEVQAPSEDEANRLLALTDFDRRRVAKKVFDWLSQPPFTNQFNHDDQVRDLLREAETLTEEPEQTDATYQLAISMAPNDRWLHINYGLFLKDRQPAAAVAEFSKAIELLPGDYEARELLADALILTGELDEAIAECEGMIVQKPYHAPAYLTMAYALAKKQSYDESILAYERAVALHPSYAVAAYNQIGIILLHQGRFDRAATSFQKAIDLDSAKTQTAELQSNLGVALARVRENAKGLSGTSAASEPQQVWQPAR